MLLSIRFGHEQHSKLCVDTNKKDTVGNEEKVKTDIVAVPDTGASMDCSGMDILGMLGIKRRHLFPTSVILRTANRKVLTVLGIVPVQVETISADRETRVKVNTMLYVVEELKCTFISKATLEDLGSIQKYFPRPSPRPDYARVASVRGPATDTVGEEKCIPATGMAGEKADCGCLLRTITPDPYVALPSYGGK